MLVWFSEAMGGTSVDRCQVATVWFTMAGTMVLWLFFAGIWQNLLALIFTVDGVSLFGNPHPNPRGERCCRWINYTAYDLPMNGSTSGQIWDGDELLNPHSCFCPATGAFYGFGGSVPEEIIK